MSKTSKIVLWVVIIVIVVVAIVWLAAPHKSNAPSAQLSGAPQSGPLPASPSNTGAPGVLATPPSDTSDAALNQDLAGINAQMNGLASDSASIDQGLNDQPISQQVP